MLAGAPGSTFLIGTEKTFPSPTPLSKPLYVLLKEITTFDNNVRYNLSKTGAK